MPSLSPEQIAQMFRKTELNRRAERLARLKNELELANEPLSAHDKEINEAALRDIKQEKLRQDKLMYPGYWNRLIAALLNK